MHKHAFKIGAAVVGVASLAGLAGAAASSANPRPAIAPVSHRHDLAIRDRSPAFVAETSTSLEDRITGDPAVHDVADDKGVDDPATHGVADDKGADDPATHDVTDDRGSDSGRSGSGHGR